MRVLDARHSAGFTLVELLVALAIFMVIMGSMSLLLSGAVRTVNQGYAMMNAMERARGAMSVLEADLKTAFASAEKPQGFQFYGEPNGFMYSGQLVSGGFGRVTYAVHVDNGSPPMQGTGGNETVTLVLPWGMVAEQFARLLCPADPANGVKPIVDKNNDGVPDITIAGVNAAASSDEIAAFQAVAGTTPQEVADRDQARTAAFRAYATRIFLQIYPYLPAEALADFEYPVEFSLRIRRGVLLRYEERGQGTLTEFSDKTMTDIFAPAVETDITPYPFGRGAEALTGLTDSTRERLDQLQQGHYWVRMLCGLLPMNSNRDVNKNGTAAPEMPAANRPITLLNGLMDPFTIDGAPPVRPFWTEDGGTGGKSWRDYVVTEGILVGAELLRPNTDSTISALDSALPDTGGQPQAVPVNVLDMASFFSYGLEDGSDRKCFNTLWNMPGVVLPSAPANAEPKPLFNYYLFGGVANFAEALRVQVYDYAPGDPLKPRLPAWVAPGFWIFGDPTRSGAPSFHQWFQQKVDIPSAYLRYNAGV